MNAPWLGSFAYPQNLGVIPILSGDKSTTGPMSIYLKMPAYTDIQLITNIALNSQNKNTPTYDPNNNVRILQ